MFIVYLFKCFISNICNLQKPAGRKSVAIYKKFSSNAYEFGIVGHFYNFFFWLVLT